MREFWAVIGGVAVGILAVTGVFAMEEDDKLRSVECNEDEQEAGMEEETDDDGELTVRAS